MLVQKPAMFSSPPPQEMMAKAKAMEEYENKPGIKLGETNQGRM